MVLAVDWKKKILKPVAEGAKITLQFLIESNASADQIYYFYDIVRYFLNFQVGPEPAVCPLREIRPPVTGLDKGGRWVPYHRMQCWGYEPVQ